MTDAVDEQDKPQPQRRSQRKRAGSRGKFVVIGSVAILGVCLLGLGVPRTIAAWYSLAAEPAVSKMAGGAKPSDIELTDAIADLEAAIAWVPSNKRLSDLGWLEAEQGVRVPAGNPQRLELLDQAENHLVAALRLGSADGVAWLRLAFVREVKAEPERQVVAALMQSLDAAPFERGYWIYRSGKLFALWPSLTLDELYAVRTNIHAMWMAAPRMRRPLLAAAEAAGQVAALNWSLADDPEAKEQLEALQSGGTTPALEK
jgi:hypothetical protein